MSNVQKQAFTYSFDFLTVSIVLSLLFFTLNYTYFKIPTKTMKLHFKMSYKILISQF